MNSDGLAPWYRWIEYAAFGRSLERARGAFLDKLSGAGRVLVLGEGDGRALRQMLAIAPNALFDVVDSSARMIALSRQHIGVSDRVHFFCEDIRSSSLPEENYDAVVTFFFLDCFTEPELQVFLRRLGPHLHPGTIWLVSDFAIPQTRWRRWHAQGWIWMMYRFFGVTTGLQASELPPIDLLLSSAGAQCTNIEAWRWGMLVSQAWVITAAR